MLAIKSDEELALVLNEKEWVLVMFGATWCKPCQRAKPSVDHMTCNLTEFGTVYADVDVLEQEPPARLPTFCLFNKGKVVETVPGGNMVPLWRMLCRTFPTLAEEF